MYRVNVFNGEMAAAWDDYTHQYGPDPAIRIDIEEQKRLFWKKIGADYGVTDIPDSPDVIFESREMAVLFTLKFGTNISVS